MTFNVKINDEDFNIDSSFIKTDGPILHAIEKKLFDDGIDKNGIESIVANATKIYSECIKGSNDSIQNCSSLSKTGMLVGKVQSGKTSNFIALSGLAFDNHIKCIVVFGGTKDNLLKQNHERIQNYFKDVIHDIVILNTKTDKSELTSSKINRFISNGKRVIIVALKHQTHIETLSNNLFGDSYLRNIPFLLLDDEGDEYTPNSKANVKKRVDDEDIQSKTYAAIKTLRERINIHIFITITATPQANIVINTLDSLSPDFCVLIDPGNGYSGLDVFHEDKRYVEIISDDENLITETSAGVPESLNKALSLFCVGAAINTIRNGKNAKFSMLIHPSHKTVDLDDVYSRVETVINLWTTSSRNTSDIAFNSVKSMFEESYRFYVNKEVLIPEFEDLLDTIILSLQDMSIHKIHNGSDFSGADFHYRNNIYVGGNMLGRGMTIKGLGITYLVRTSKGKSNADTVLQRARWFGYRNKILDLCVVYLTKSIADDFENLREHEEDLWYVMREHEKSNLSFKLLNRTFILDSQMNLTRKSVGKTSRIVAKSWNICNIFEENNANIANNLYLLDRMYEKYEKDLSNLNSGGLPILKTSDIKLEDIYKEFLIDYVFPKKWKFSNKVFDKMVTTLYKDNPDMKVNLIWMRRGETSKHKVTNNVIPNYMVGRRPRGDIQESSYHGDRMQFSEEKITIQIHMIEDTETERVSPTLAIHIPLQYIRSFVTAYE